MTKGVDDDGNDDGAGAGWNEPRTPAQQDAFNAMVGDVMDTKSAPDWVETHHIDTMGVWEGDEPTGLYSPVCSCGWHGEASDHKDAILAGIIHRSDKRASVLQQPDDLDDQ